MADTLYHLADGVILSIGPLNTQLVDLERDFEVHVDFRLLQALERVTLGADLKGYESYLPQLVQEGMLVPGPAAVDQVLAKRLRLLDGMFMSAYASQLSPRARRAHELLVAAHCRRKRFFERVGQCPVLPETALRRALRIGDAEVVGRKRVLCLGDDDLMSVALAALGHEVVAYDIDDYLLAFLQHVAKDLALDIAVQERDLRDPLEAKDLATFDALLTDPMSNRDCFELFLSRGLALLKPGGVGYTAVFAPVGRLFRQVADEMGLRLTNWWARHNRYYSKYLRLHDYESDWVAFEKTAASQPKFAADAFSVPLNLYREDHLQRPKNLLAFFDQLNDARRAMPLFLDMVLDGLQQLTGIDLQDRILITDQVWSVIHCPTPEGYLTLHVDRDRRQIIVDMFPFDAAIEERLRQLLMAGFKTDARGAMVAMNRSSWDVRVR